MCWVAEQLWPGILLESFERYQEKFRPLLGIRSKATLRLLHKTQSTKDMGDLNTFVRDFMLEEPGTFDLAKALVDKFQELDTAYKSVLDAQAQIDTLQPVCKNHFEHEEGKTQQVAHDVVVKSADAFMHQREGALVTERLEALKRDLTAEQLNIETAERVAGDRLREFGVLKEQYWHMGGGKADFSSSHCEHKPARLALKEPSYLSVRIRILDILRVIATNRRCAPELIKNAFGDIEVIVCLVRLELDAQSVRVGVITDTLDVRRVNKLHFHSVSCLISPTLARHLGLDCAMQTLMPNNLPCQPSSTSLRQRLDLCYPGNALLAAA